jgi:hypothetical protein
MMTIAVGSSTAAGTDPITVTGNGGGIQQSAKVTLTVTAAPNFTLSASPATLSYVATTLNANSVESVLFQRSASNRALVSFRRSILDR